MRKAVGEARAANKRRILASLQSRPNSSARDVAAALGITPMSAARTLQEMERLDRSVVVCGQTEYRRRYNKGRRTIPTYRIAGPIVTPKPKFPPWLECVDVSAWRRGLNGAR